MSEPGVCVKKEVEDPDERDNNSENEDRYENIEQMSPQTEKKAKKRKKQKKHKSNKRKKKSKELQEDPDFQQGGHCEDGSENESRQNKKIKRQRPKKLPCPHSQCGVKLTSVKELKQHLPVHETSECKRPHKCDMCCRAFARKAHLQRHKSSAHDSGHNPERPWCCERCPATFVTRSELTGHSSRHQGPMPHPCTVCRMSFATNDELVAHVMDAEHEPGRALCRFCGELFESRDVRRSHAVVAHSGDYTIHKCEECETLETCLHRSPTTDEDLTESEEEYAQDALELEHSMDEAEQHFVDQLNREKVNLDLQYTIVNKMSKGRLVTDICRDYNLSQDIVNEIWDRRDSILGVSQSSRMDKETCIQVDKKLIAWYNKKKAQNDPITGKMMIDKAEEFAYECGSLNFNSNIKWIDRFKKRHNISLRSVPHKREPYSGVFGKKVKDVFILDNWPKIRVGFTDEDIFTADEIGVFYNTSNGRIVKKMSKKYIHGHPKDRFAIFMCTNMTGNEKKKLLVCGVDDPLKSSSRSPDTLPVRYIRNKYAHFTTAIFEEEIKNWDAQLEREKRRAILILDRASIHTKMMTLNLKLVFVPWKASTILMPVKNGIAATFREEYRKLMLLAKVQNVMRGIDRRLTCLEGLEMLSKAWCRVNNDVIIKSFSACGFEAINKYPQVDYKVSPSYTLNDQMLLSKWLSDYDVDIFYTDLTKLDNYLMVDEELLTDTGTHGSVFGGNRKAKEIVYPEKNDEGHALPIGTEQHSDNKELILNKLRALQDMEIVRRYLESTDTSYELFNSFAAMEMFLVRNPVRSVVNVSSIKQET